MRWFLMCLLWLWCVPRVAGQAPAQPLVVATTSIFADMAAVISGGLLEVRSIVPRGSDPHMHEPTPADVQLAARASLILMNGLTLEGWMAKMIAGAGSGARVVTITEGIAPIESGTYRNSYDPHAWMDAANGRVYIRNIRDALVAVDPVNADVYDFNYRLYDRELAELDTAIRRELSAVPEARRVLVTSHDAFRYFGRRYGIRVEAVLGTSTDAEARIADVRRLHQLLQQTGVPAIFVESSVNPKIIEQIARDNGVAIGGSLYADSLGDSLSPAATYVGMLRHNSRLIATALSGGVKNAAAAQPRQPPGAMALMAVLMLGSLIYMVYRLNKRV